jgi:small subunit ribosomal protein S1
LTEEREERIEGWLTEAYDYERPRRGQVREGIVLTVDEHGVMVDVGLKRDGFVPESDIERLGEDAMAELEPGDEVEARVVRPEDRDGNLVLSLYQARLKKDWDRAQAMMESGELYEGEVLDFNKGGLIVEFGGLRGFIPGSHLWASAQRRFSQDQRKELFEEYLGQELSLKVIEVDRDKRRLILSERRARRQMRKKRRTQLLEELVEGQVVEGTVRRLTDFGAFVDLGGADGLIHVSELAWRYVEHPREVLDAGDEVKVYVLRLDHARKRIALSLKRLQPHPWELVDRTYAEGQLVEGTVSGITDFGAFVTLDAGVEGLVHISELSDPPPQHPRDVVSKGYRVLLRILNIDVYRERIGLSRTQVSADEREEWLARQSEEDQEEETEKPASRTEPEGVAAATVLEDTPEEMAPEKSESVAEETSLEPVAL